MHQFILLIFLFFHSAALLAQGMIGLNKKKAKITLVKYIEKHHFTNSLFAETDTSISLSIKDSTVKPVEFQYHFNSRGKCNAEEKISICEECISELKKEILSYRKWNWKKINDSLYASGFSKGLLFEIHNDGQPLRFIKIKKLDRNKRAYNSLFENKN